MNEALIETLTKASIQLNYQELKSKVYSVICVLACGPVFSGEKCDDPNKISLEIRWLPEVPQCLSVMLDLPTALVSSEIPFN